MEQFKPNQPKNLPAKKLIGYGIPFVMGIVFGIMIINSREDFPEAWGYWLCLVLAFGTSLLTAGKVIQMLIDYRNGRTR